jgi:hypothetical protein
MSGAKFSPGSLYATPGVLEAFRASGDDIFAYLVKHLALDPGELSPEDVRANEESLRLGERLLSAYRMSNGTKFWIITERDRSSTCFLLPDEY